MSTPGLLQHSLESRTTAISQTSLPSYISWVGPRVVMDLEGRGADVKEAPEFWIPEVTITGSRFVLQRPLLEESSITSQDAVFPNGDLLWVKK